MTSDLDIGFLKVGQFSLLTTRKDIKRIKWMKNELSLQIVILLT